MPPLGSKQAERVEIGCARYRQGEIDDTCTWADLEKIVRGIRWLVKGWLPYGMLTGLIGDPKAGKSAFALGSLVRSAVRGEHWFTGELGMVDPKHVLFCDTERSGAINVHRARKWGVPVERLLTPFADDPLKAVNLEDQSHVERIWNVVCRYQVPLVVVDSFRGSHDSNENDSRLVRPLRGLASIAEETNCAMLLIHHIKKLKPDEILTANSARGSNAFLAAVRCQLAVDRPVSSSQWRRLQVLGENLGTNPDPVGFLITDTGLEFGPPPAAAKRATAKQECKTWLTSTMRPGEWYLSSEIDEGAKAAGYSSSALQRAKVDLGVVRPANVRLAHGVWRCRRLP